MTLSVSPIVLIILRSSVHAPPKFKMAAILANFPIFFFNFSVYKLQKILWQAFSAPLRAAPGGSCPPRYATGMLANRRHHMYIDIVQTFHRDAGRMGSFVVLLGCDDVIMLLQDVVIIVRRAKLGKIQGGGGLQRVNQDLTNGDCNIFSKFYAIKISLFRVSMLIKKKTTFKNKKVHL